MNGYSADSFQMYAQGPSMGAPTTDACWAGGEGNGPKILLEATLQLTCC